MKEEEVAVDTPMVAKERVVQLVRAFDDGAGS